MEEIKQYGSECMISKSPELIIGKWIDGRRLWEIRFKVSDVKTGRVNRYSFIDIGLPDAEFVYIAEHIVSFNNSDLNMNLTGPMDNSMMQIYSSVNMLNKEINILIKPREKRYDSVVNYITLRYIKSDKYE